MGRIRKKLAPVISMEEYKGRKAGRAVDAHHAISPDFKMRDTPRGQFVDAEALGWFDEPIHEDSDPTPPHGTRRPSPTASKIFRKPMDRLFRFIEGPAENDPNRFHVGYPLRNLDKPQKPQKKK